MTSTKDEEDHKHQYLCNGCIKPISRPFYRCLQCTDFFLHSCCANLPSKVRPPAYRDRRPLVLHRRLVLRRNTDAFSRFKCDACERYCNGFVYTDRATTFLDVGCYFMPRLITHEAHPKSHILALSSLRTDESIVSARSCLCCGKQIDSMFYACLSCRQLQLHVGCAMLPKTVTHKYDKHPLKLIFTRSGLNKLLLTTGDADDKECFCEICEKSMNTKFWFYGCEECDNLFHINCLPSVGRLSKFKFGDTIRVQGHDCPLTSIRLLTDYSHRCGICGKTIPGFVDKMAFECSKCDFRVHYKCAKKQRLV